MSQERRRLAAIMFTDMVGYTALAQRNEPLSLVLVEEQRKLVRPILARHQGREVKTIGDAFLVEFPNALDAVRCAYDIQRATREFNFSQGEERRIHLRIGVHLGDVIESNGDISGDAVNVASRIEHFADDGGVCMTRQVYDHVHNKFELTLTSLGAQPLKNVLEPVEVFSMKMPWRSQEDYSQGPPDAKRVAVLPFANISPDPSDEYFADGMTEELIDRLSQVKELKVIARTSVMSYKRKELKASEIARELGVGTLVEGSVRKDANKVRVTVQLIAAGTQEHVWSSRYDKELSDIFAVQSEIAENVAKELRVQLVESDKRALEVRPTNNTEAYTLYLKGRYYWNERTKESVEKGIQYLRKAIRIDPDMALAYSDLADAHVMAGDYGMMSASEALAKVQENATMALKLDPNMSQPHAALAFVHERSFQWDESESELQRALTLNPNNVTARHWLALSLFLRGERRRALSEWVKAHELDPLSLILGAAHGYALVRTGQRDEGFEMLKRTIEMNDAFPVAHRNMAYGYVAAGMPREAVDEARKLLAIGKEGENLADAAIIFANAGIRDESLAMLDRLLSGKEGVYVDPFDIGSIHAALGNAVEALEWLERAVNEKSAGVAYIKAFPQFDSFGDHPKFKELLSKMNLT